MSLLQIAPKISPVLDPDFRPAFLGHKNFTALAKASGKAVPLLIALERGGGAVTRFDTVCFAPGQPGSEDNFFYAERLVKFLLWQRGGFKVSLCAPPGVAEHLAQAYAPGGSRAFDADFFRKVYAADAFVIQALEAAQMPASHEPATAVGRNWKGCRIGFDAGGSDRKVAAVMDGKEVYSAEVVWEPKVNSDWNYHVQGVRDSIAQAAKHLPRVDAIGVSTAGICVDKQVRVSSLFRKVQDEHPGDFEAHLKGIYADLSAQWGGVPVEVANDGDVTALAGAMSLEANQVLGIAMGTSQAAGYVDAQGSITGWLNELAFAPVDYAQAAPEDKEWSGDRGTGVNYFSQDAVIRLAEKLGLHFKPADSPGVKLKQVQLQLKSGDKELAAIFETIGVYLGYALLQYAEFYGLKHVLLLGRVTSGLGGEIIITKAREVLEAEDPDLAGKLGLHLPDEASRRLGQAVAAASLPGNERGG